MQPIDFTEDAAGRLVKNLSGNWAFVPNSLPPELRWTSDLVSELAVADHALGRLSGLSDTLVSPRLLARPFIHREAVLSSYIEGTRATLEDLYLFEEAAPVENRVPDVREVANYVRALDLALQAVRDRPITLGLIQGMHKVLMEGVRGGDKTPGAFRTVQNFIGRTHRIEEARYVPPPPLEVIPCMHDLVQFIQSSGHLPPLVVLPLVHYQFEAIHPFQDGNGRVGRLLLMVLLCARGVLSEPLLYLSAYFERHRREYYDGLLEVSRRGAWDDWIRFFARAVASEANDAIDRAERLRQLHRQYRDLLLEKRASAVLLRLLDELFVTPAVTAQRAAKALKITVAAAQRNIDRLVDAGMLRNATQQKRNRVFLAPHVLRIIGAQPPARRDPSQF